MNGESTITPANRQYTNLRGHYLPEKLKDICSDFTPDLVPKDSKYLDIDQNKRAILQNTRHLLSQLTDLQRELREHTLRDHDIVPKHLNHDPQISRQLLQFCSQGVLPQQQALLKHLDDKTVKTASEPKQKEMEENFGLKRDKINDLIGRMALDLMVER